jgi:cell division septum initiation protein DivIVA
MVKLNYNVGPRPVPPVEPEPVLRSDESQELRDQLEDLRKELAQVKQSKDELAQGLDSLQHQLSQKTDSHQDLSQS